VLEAPLKSICIGSLVSHVLSEFAIVDALESGPGSTAGLGRHRLLVDAVLVCLLVGPLGTLPGRLSVLLRCVLLASLDVLSSEVLLDCSRGHIACCLGQELVVLGRLLLLFLGGRRSLLSRVGAHVVALHLPLRVLLRVVVIRGGILLLCLALAIPAAAAAPVLIVILLALIIVLLLLLWLLVLIILLLLLIIATLIVILRLLLLWLRILILLTPRLLRVLIRLPTLTACIILLALPFFHAVGEG